MTLKNATLLSTLLLAVSSAHAATSQPIRLTTFDTALTFEAGPSAPRLAHLRLRNSEASWANRTSEPLINHVQVGGDSMPTHWQYSASASHIGPVLVQFVYDSLNPHLRLLWQWRIRYEYGPIEHSIEIQNMSSSEVWLPLQDSFAFEAEVPATQSLEQMWIEKGASSPSGVGVHHAPIDQGFLWSGTSSTYAHPRQGEQREMIPYLLIEDAHADRSGFYLGIEFSGRTRISLHRDRNLLTAVASLDPEPGPFRTRLMAGESFHTPTVFVGAFHGGPDGAANVLRHWIRRVLNNPVTIQDASYPLLVSNSWGAGMAISEAQAHKMIEDAAALGLEMFHLDAGWFRGVGDWVSNPDKFPNGVDAVAGYAHQRGLKFGLWTDWTQAGISPHEGALSVKDPAIRDWLTVEPPSDWKPAEFKGITIDLGVAAAHAWAARTVHTIVRDYHLDMLEHDGYLVAQGCDRSNHPHAPPDPAHTRNFRDEDFLWSEGPNSTDVSYYATRAYYDIYSELRRSHPRLLLEICNDGGRMVDFGSAAHGDYFSMSDGYDPLSNRRTFYDASYVFPPAMLEAYVEKWSTPHIENFRYMLRSGMMGWFSLMQDSSTWTPEQLGVARDEFAIYKSRLRPLIRQADIYHVSPRPDGIHWDGIEYFDPLSHRGVLFAFRGAALHESTRPFVLQGLEAARRYRVSFHDHTSTDRTFTGAELMQTGLQVFLPSPNSSELVFLERNQI